MDEDVMSAGWLETTNRKAARSAAYPVCLRIQWM